MVTILPISNGLGEWEDFYCDKQKHQFESSNSFLSSVLRNSRMTNLAYPSALNHLQLFLKKNTLHITESIFKPWASEELLMYKIWRILDK